MILGFTMLGPLWKFLDFEDAIHTLYFSNLDFNSPWTFKEAKGGTAESYPLKA